MKLLRFIDIVNEAKTRSPKTKLKVGIGKDNFYDKDASITFFKVIEYICDLVGVENFAEDFPKLIKKDKSEFAPYTSLKINSTGEYFINTHSSTEEKKEILEKILLKYNIDGTIDIVLGSEVVVGKVKSSTGKEKSLIVGKPDNSKPNEFQQALCILGKSGVGKSTTTEYILKEMDYEYDLIIPTATTTSLLSQFSPSKGGGDIRPSRLGKLIMKAFNNPNKNFVAIIDECHKSSTIEMINDELLQSISKSRNIDRTISLDDDSAKLFTGLNKDKYGNLIIPNNFGFIFLSSKPDIITSNSDFFNRVNIKVLTKNPKDDRKPESFNDSEYFTDVTGDSLYRKSKSDIIKIKELISDNES